MTNFLVVIPVCNEGKTLKLNINRIKNFLDNYCGHYQLIIACNGSTDNTIQIANELSKKYKNINSVCIPKRGKGLAIKSAFKSYNSDVYAYIDADIPVDLKDFISIIKEVENNHADICIGSKALPESKTLRPLPRFILSKIFNFMINLIFCIRISDTQGGFKALNKEVVDSILNNTRDMKFFWDTELLILAHRKGYKIKEIPVSCIDKNFSLKMLIEAIPNLLYSTAKLWFRLL